MTQARGGAERFPVKIAPSILSADCARLIPNTIRKLHALGQMLREQGAGCEVEVDGGINAQTAPSVVAAGAEVLVAGSAVFNKKASVAENIPALRRSCLGLVQSGVKEAAGDT